MSTYKRMLENAQARILEALGRMEVDVLINDRNGTKVVPASLSRGKRIASRDARVSLAYHQPSRALTLDELRHLHNGGDVILPSNLGGEICVTKAADQTVQEPEMVTLHASPTFTTAFTPNGRVLLDPAALVRAWTGTVENSAE